MGVRSGSGPTRLRIQRRQLAVVALGSISRLPSFFLSKKNPPSAAELNEGKIIGTLGRMSTNCECCRELGAVQRAESAASCSTSTVRCCAHSEQLNMSRLQLGVPVREKSYSRIARPQLGHAGVLPTGCSDELNKLNWGMAPLLALPTNSKQRNLFRDWLATVCVSMKAYVSPLATVRGIKS
jgi:hypothetical protein